MHDLTSEDHWHEPTGMTSKAGLGTFKKPPMPYDVFMEEQEIPIVRAVGVSRVQDLPLKPWKRMGGKGTFIQLWGTEGLWGMHLVEVPGGGALNVEKHLYEEQYLVVEGRGSTEVWTEGGKVHMFEWQKGSLFAIPLNAYHRIVNASSSPALLLGGTSAPNAMNLYGNQNFIFNNDFVFQDRFDGRENYFKPADDIASDPVRGLAMRRTNLVPDVLGCDLPLDNRRSPGYRRIEPHMANNRFYMWIGEHETGRYAKAHKHGSAAVLICLKGKGYTYTWPSELGTHPFSEGKADQVFRVDYEPVGMVSAAPMSGDSCHQHFGIGRQPLRMSAWFGPNNARGRRPGRPGEKEKDLGAIDIRDGGNAIPYDEEDPLIRREFEDTQRREGAVSRMEDWLYVTPKEGEARPMTDFVGM